jgi:hypothetical protein
MRGHEIVPGAGIVRSHDACIVATTLDEIRSFVVPSLGADAQGCWVAPITALMRSIEEVFFMLPPASWGIRSRFAAKISIVSNFAQTASRKIAFN